MIKRFPHVHKMCFRETRELPTEQEREKTSISYDKIDYLLAHDVMQTMPTAIDMFTALNERTQLTSNKI